MAQKTTTFLMFQNGDAEKAMNFYLSLFDDAKVVNLARFEPGEPGPEGKIKNALFTLAGQEYMCMDSPVEHPFTFTPSVSIYVGCDTEEEIDHLFAALSEGGQTLMPLGSYGYSTKFAWLKDRFGVAWQLNLP
jgi:predicted 3-demethylubiquinone-9 3-methyltransferase (glyoxalase superfamily)